MTMKFCSLEKPNHQLVTRWECIKWGKSNFSLFRCLTLASTNSSGTVKWSDIRHIKITTDQTGNAKWKEHKTEVVNNAFRMQSLVNKQPCIPVTFRNPLGRHTALYLGKKSLFIHNSSKRCTYQ